MPYNFIKNVADKHLGKTFLIKIPKACNANYDKEISTKFLNNEIQN